MSLAKRIHALMSETGEPMTMKEIYKAMPDELKHSIRARVYCNLSDGTAVSKTGKGLFIRVAKGTYAINRGDE